MNNRWLTVGLIVSIAINLLFVGIAIGRSSNPAWSANVDPAFGFGRILRTFPDERRREILRSVDLRDSRPPVREMRLAQRDANAAMVAQPFDAEGLADALAELRRLMAEGQVRSHLALVSIMAQLSDAERQLVLAEMSRRGPGGAIGAGAPPHERGPRGLGRPREGRPGEGPRGEPGGFRERQRRERMTERSAPPPSDDGVPPSDPVER